MKRLWRLVILAGLLAALLAAGGCKGSNRQASDLLLDRGSINRVEVYLEQQGTPVTEVTEPGRIQELLALLDGVEVRRLSRAEDVQFMQNGRRMLEPGLLRVTLEGPGTPSMRGEFMVFAGGQLYIADLQSMLKNPRTVSYLSLAPQQELYDWLNSFSGKDLEAPVREKADLNALSQAPVQSRSPDGGTLALFRDSEDGIKEGEIYLWRPPAEPVPVAAEWRVHTLEWSADGRYVLSQAGSSALSSTKIIAAADNRVMEQFQSMKALWSPDGRMLAAAKPHPGVKPSVAMELNETLDLALYRVGAGRWEVLAPGSEDYYYMPVRWTPDGVLIYEKINFPSSPRETGHILPPADPDNHSTAMENGSLEAAMAHVNLAPAEEVKWMEFCTNAFLFEPFPRNTYTVDYDYYYVNEGDVNPLVLLKPEEFISEIHREPGKFPKPFANGRLLLRKVTEDGQERYIIMENVKNIPAT